MPQEDPTESNSPIEHELPTPPIESEIPKHDFIPLKSTRTQIQKPVPKVDIGGMSKSEINSDMKPALSSKRDQL